MSPWSKHLYSGTMWRVPVLVLLLTNSARTKVLTQDYCSSQNTGSDTTPNIDNYQSLGHCSQTICGPQGYAYGIVQYKSCWCSDYAPADQLSISSCNQGCPGYGEDCGNQGASLFGYIATGNKPSGTAGGGDYYYGGGYGGYGGYGQSTQPPPVETVTEVNTVQNTVLRTVVTVEHKTQVIPVKITKGTTKTTTKKPTGKPYTTIQVVTIGEGQVSTQVVTAYQTAPPQYPATPDFQSTTTSSGLSGGAIAGIVVGVIVGLILLALIAFFLCWKPRRRDGDGSLNRNTSVLSKVGLLRSGSTNQPPTAPATYSNTSIVAPVAPRIETTGLPSGNRSAEPSSAATANTMETRRGSKPLFVDQRLNPHALTLHENTSRTSIGTLQDNEDYSRPLEVRNPDPL